jgi:ribonucleases P/MRP protein subunit RPP40
LRALDIVDKIHTWIEDWLKDRKQRVILLGANSDWIRVKSRVPQGSVFGPLSFLIYVKFADDAKIFGVVASQDYVRKLQGDLKNVCRWSIDWLMLLTVETCKVMHIGYNN